MSSNKHCVEPMELSIFNLYRGLVGTDRFSTRDLISFRVDRNGIFQTGTYICSFLVLENDVIFNAMKCLDDFVSLLQI